MIVFWLILLYIVPGFIVFFKNHDLPSFLKGFLYPLVSIIVSTLVIFWIFYFQKQNSILLLLPIAILLISFFLRVLFSGGIAQRISLKFEKKDFWLIVVLFSFVSMVLALYSPIIRPIIQDGWKFYRLPQIGDLYKHLYTVTTIKELGLMPHHPYLASVPMSYYFGYYLVPAAIVKLTAITVPWAFYIHYAVTLWCFSFALLLVALSFKKFWNRLFFVWFSTFAFGLDLIGTYIVSKGLNQPFFDHIEAWGWKFGYKLQVSSPAVAAIWVPQHLFATILCWCLFFVLTKWKESVKKYVISGLLLATIIFCSMFVAVAGAILVFWYFLTRIFASYKKTGRVLFDGVILTIITVGIYLPFYKFSLQSRSSLLQFWLDNHGGIGKFTEWVFLEWGILLWLFVFFSVYLYRKQKLMLLWCWSIFVMTLLVCTPVFNDLGMRSLLPAQFGIVFLVFYALEVKNIRYFWIIVVISGVIGSIGSLKEFKDRWQKREVYTWSESQVVEGVKKYIPLGKTVGVYPSSEDKRWIELIPMLGERDMISPDFISSSVYYISKQNSPEENFMSLYRDIVMPERRDKYMGKFSLKEAYITLFSDYKSLGTEYVMIPKMVNPKKTEELYEILDSDKDLEYTTISDYRLYKVSEVISSLNKWKEKPNRLKTK